MKPHKKYCAIYTRKSTEEGLDQEFNTLHAQREACEAYILSQKAEGWVASKTLYDDGGFSGGNMKRPGLTQLIEDIKSGKVNIVVVYKIDRLTRSLMDFSKLVDVFDEHDVTFVSVTQSFNTTTSMGRLTLNVLLSFAQFEREVGSERVRDKIAASKKKGMWMGGITPLGYDVKDKKLIINKEQAEMVRFIFTQYLKVKAIYKLQKELEHKGIKSPLRVTRKGKTYGGHIYSRGALHSILQNPIYIGKVRHKDQVYDGLHDAILEENTWDTVQVELKKKSPHARGLKKYKTGKILQGKLFDCDGKLYGPTYTTKSGKRYDYYISQNLIKNKDPRTNMMARFPAFEIEKVVLRTVKKYLSKPNYIYDQFLEYSDNLIDYLQSHPLMINDNVIYDMLNKAIITQEGITLYLDTKKLREEIKGHVKIDPGAPLHLEAKVTSNLKSRLARSGAMILNTGMEAKDDPFNLEPEVLERIVKGVIWREEHFSGSTLLEIAQTGQHSPRYVRRCIVESLNFPC